MRALLSRSARCPLAIGVVFALLTATQALSQCPNNNSLTGGTVTPTCPGTTTVPCVQGGQYARIAVTAGYIYTFATCGAGFDTQITLYNNTGGGNLGFNDDYCGLQSQVTWTATFTGQLRVLVDQFFCANNTTCAPLTITCASPPPPVTNDTPCNSLLRPVVQNCGHVAFSNVGGGNSNTNPAPTCSNYNGASQDVWFRFVAGPLGQVNIQSNAGTLTDGAMAVYSAPSCSGPFTQIACDDDSGPGLMPQLSLSNLTPGQTYYIRYWGYGNNTGTFTLCIQGVTTLPAGDCVYVLNMYDSFGDGWGSSSVSVSINGGPFQNYTVTGSFNQAVFGVYIGQIVLVQYTNTGPFQGENSYTLGLASGGILFNSGSPPLPGISYANTVSCQPPPAPPEDCIGSITVCSGQSFNNTTTNTGNVADLNFTSAGCLSTLERQGTWYNFSPTSNGTVAFDIAPTNPLDDYDFAIWGPFPPGSTPSSICPPLNAPLRCSFAAPTGTTGLNYTATDLTEGAGGDKWVRYLNVTAGEVYLLYISNFSQSGVAFNLNWNLGGGASLDCTILPIELAAFNAREEGGHVLLDWTTTSELGTSHYEVQRKDRNADFHTIGAVPASGTSLITSHYALVDEHPQPGVDLYRLKVVDLDGTSTFSETISILFRSPFDVLKPYPNPSDGTIHLDLVLAEEETLIIRILDASGRLVRSYQQPFGPGPQHFQAPVAELDAGTYEMVLSGRSEEPVHAGRFIVQ